MAPNDEREQKDEPTSNAADESETTKGDHQEDMVAYVEALHAFSHLVATMEWPEQMDLAMDTELSVRMFRDYWRQQRRQAHENARKHRGDHGAFGTMSEEAVRDFFKRRFRGRWSFDEHDEPLHIDPEEHQPDEEHVDEEAKKRQQRFRDEWE
ncbi:MAG: hypothetical protein VW102_04275 [Poseidonia sp.]